MIYFHMVNIKRLGILILAVYVGLVLFGWLASDTMIFLPPKDKYEKLPGEIILKTSDGESLTALWLENPKARHVILFSHGNAENLGQNVFYFEWLRREGFSVFAYDYRGYGRSTGSPSVNGVYRDIEAAYLYLTENLKIPPQRIIIHGRSVGSGPSTWLASTKPVGGLILESPFKSAFKVVIPFPPILGDKFPNLSRIRNVKCPLLVIHGEVNDVIPISHGRKIYDRHRGPKMALWMPEAGHNDILQWAGDDYWKSLRRFSESLP